MVRKTEAFIKDLLANADVELNGERPWDMQVHDPSLYDAVCRQGSLGLGEAYMAGLWDCARLDAFFHRILRARLDEKVKTMDAVWMAVVAKLRNNQSASRAWEVGKVHYNLGNAFYRDMLGPTMAYSCGYWLHAGSLEEAQNAKLKMICEKLQLKPGMRLLDIGCGWGGLAAYAARNYGVSVDGVTISREQQKLAQQRCEGLDVNILLQDYRDLNTGYDRIVSVGMFEHVGPKNYDTYFSVVDRCLKADGLFLLHTIGSNQTGLSVDPWINKYIFPNGCLPSIRQIASVSESRLIMEDWHNFGSDYDKTLMAWHQRFNQAWSGLSSNYTPRFRRMFNYYLCACAGAFRARPDREA